MKKKIFQNHKVAHGFFFFLRIPVPVLELSEWSVLKPMYFSIHFLCFRAVKLKGTSPPLSEAVAVLEAGKVTVDTPDVTETV